MQIQYLSNKQRGRVFYNMNTDTYEVAVGKWLEDYPQAYDLILEEFNLPWAIFSFSCDPAVLNLKSGKPMADSTESLMTSLSPWSELDL